MSADNLRVTRRNALLLNVLDVACPQCFAPIGERCARLAWPNGARLTRPHKAREAAHPVVRRDR